MTIIVGDCLEVMAGMEPESVDSCVTDPPYHLTNRTPDVKWCMDCARVLGGRDGNPPGCPRCGGRLENQRSQGQRGFMGKTWDGGDIAFRPETWAAVYRVLKPGAWLLAFSGTRTQHRMVCAIEDAGFEIRDQIGWAYGSGFPKSLDVSKAIDKAAGAQGSLGEYRTPDHAIKRKPGNDRSHEGYQRPWRDDPEAEDRSLRQYIPATPEAAQWQGWGTALKPAWEPICVARKPLVGTVAANVLRHGTGALNIDGCRVETDGTPRAGHLGGGNRQVFSGDSLNGYAIGDHARNLTTAGRWPANLVTSYPEDEYELRGDVTPEQQRELFGWLHENA